MLKRIPIDDARLGMHVHRLEGDWMSHPFWRNRFVIERPADLDKLVRSGIRYLWIDLARGVDSAAPAAQGDAAPAPDGVPARPPGEPLPAAPPSIRRRSTRVEEQRLAGRLIAEARPVAWRLHEEARLGRLIDQGQAVHLVEQVMASIDRHQGALVSLVRLKDADEYTYLHSVAVSALMVALARQLNLCERDCLEAGLAGLLHDIGKSRIAIEVLNKPGRLTEEEWAQVREHPRRGYELLATSPDTPASVRDACLHHHERADGGGYPDGLAGEAIALITRMASVCDVYDAITSDRPYKRAWSPAESIARMASWKSHFDEDVLKAFVRCLGIYPVGSVVRLASGRMAVVVEHHPGHAASPSVKAFFSLNGGHGIEPVLIDLRSEKDRIVAHEDAAPWGPDRIQALWLGDGHGKSS